MIDASNSAAMRRVVFPRTYRSANWRLLSTAALVPPLLCFTAPGHAQTLPSGGNVVAGTATIGAASGGRLDITQTSDRAIVEWSDFSIGAGGRVHIDNGSGATLNRVKGQSVSSLDGMLTSTGSVYLINPNGVIVGESGVIDVGGSFIGSTLDIQNSKFLAGGNIELLGNSTASVVNFGKIGALGGDVVLAAVNVENHGTIEALSGTAGLAGGTFVVLADQAHANGRLKVVTGGAGTSVSNRGTIEAAVAELRANGGNIYALAGDTRGIIKAQGVASVDGRVFLTAGAGGTVDITSTDISARAASGEGGSIVVGGTGAARVSINQDASLNASAFFNGPGGSIETSAAKVTIADDAIIMTFGSEAEAGTWTIAANDFVVGPNGNIAASTLSSALDLNNVTIKGLDESGGNSGDIVVNGALFWDANNKLTLASDRDIVINSSITANGLEAGLVLDHGAGRDYLVNLDNSARITLSGANATLNIEGQNYTLIHDVNQLQDIDLDLNGHYALAGTIDASATAGWNSGAGFDPIGDGTNSFTGILTGLGNSIDGLTIKLNDTVDGKAVGLVANLSGMIRDTSILGGSFSGVQLVGAFAGLGSGTLSNVRSNSDVSGLLDIGGLMGHSTGTIRAARALAGASVTGQLNVGGVLGRGGGEISSFLLNDVTSYAAVISSATGDIFDGQNLTGENAGGVLGHGINGVVTNVHAYGDVSGTVRVGGLIGRIEQSDVNNSSTDNVVSSSSGGDSIGGLIGFTIAGTVSYSRADGTVSGGKATGGLIGHTLGTMISNVTSTADVSGARGIGVGIGGLVGVLWGGTLTDSSATGGLVQGWIDYGGLVGTNRGAIVNSSSSNRVVAFNLGIDNDFDDFAAGGLVGTNYGVIRNSSSTSSVDARTAVGGLVGLNFGRGDEYGQIYESSASGPVTATRGNVGGLVGTNSGLISKSFAKGAVSGESRAGGLAGANDGINAVISESWASGDVSVPVGGNEALQGYEAGGLVGNNYDGARISRSYATGNVQGSNAIGGLVGRNLNSEIIDAYATGNVQGNYWLGGLVGVNSGLLSDVFASGNVYGNEFVGGLVGDNSKPLGGVVPVLVQRAYASGTVSGVRRVGGLVGANSETITLAYATGAVTLRDDPYGTAGGLVGENSGLVRHTYSSGAVINDAGGIVGGLVGTNDDLNGGSIESSYWDTQNSGLLYSAGGSGRTTAQMHDQQTFAGWDFAGTWAPTESSYMPMLYGVSGVVGVTVGTVSRVYGDDNSVISNVPVTYIGNGFWNSISGTPTFTSTTDSRSNAGSYGLTGSGVSGARAQGGASRIAYVGTLQIDPRAITVSALGGRSTYGDTPGNPGLSATGLVNGEDVSVLTGLYNTFGITNASGAGTYTLSVGGALTNGNYTVTTLGTGTWVVDPRAITVSALGGRSTYGDTPGNPGLSATGLVNGEDVSVLTGLYNTFGITNASGAGTYTLSVGGALTNGNYTVTTLGTGTWVVDPRAITVSALGGRSTYGDTPGNPGLSATGLVNGEDVSVLTGLYNTFGITNASGAGTYTLSVGGALTNGNYTVASLGTGTWVVDPRGILVQVIANDITRKYGEANPALTYTATGLIGTDQLSGNLETEATLYSDVGSYAITLGSLTAGGNYSIAFTPGTLTIVARDLYVAADYKTRAYGDDNPLLTYTVGGDGFVFGQNFTGSLTTGADRQSRVGYYDIEQGSLSAGQNYTIHFTRNQFQISPRALIVTAANQSRIYGDANPALTYRAEGLVNGDQLTGALQTGANARSAVGDYAIAQGGLQASENYTMTFNAGTLTITPRALMVAAANQTRQYGDANPALSYTATGLVNGDTLTGSLSTAAKSASNVGNYAITQGDLAASGNYLLTFKNGSLQVVPRTVIVAADNKSRQQGEANPAFTYTVTGLVNDDVVSGALTTLATESSKAGRYAITGDGLSAGANYEIRYIEGVLTVLPLPATGAGDPVDPVDPGPDYPFLEKHVPQAVANGPAFIHFLPDCSDDEEMLSVYPANLPAHPAPCPLKAL